MAIVANGGGAVALQKSCGEHQALWWGALDWLEAEAIADHLLTCNCDNDYHRCMQLAASFYC